MTITERTLLDYLECPLRSPAIPAWESPILPCAEYTARWLTAELAKGHAPTCADTRGFFENELNQMISFQKGSPPKKYALWLRKGIHACFRLREILWRCEILQPVTPYTLHIHPQAVLTGEYAVLRSSRRKKHAVALYLRYQGVKIRPLVPDVVSFARCLDLGTLIPNHPDWGIESLGVLHYWISPDLSAEHTPDREAATQVMLGAAGVLSGHPFPVPGAHCLSCPTRACHPKLPIPLSSDS